MSKKADMSKNSQQIDKRGSSLFMRFATSTGLLAAAVFGQPVADLPGFLLMLAVGSLAAPLGMLMLGVAAANKIEGMAIAKLVSSLSIVPARNAYRTSMINLVTARRSLEQLQDSITADLRDELRETRSQLEAYQIQLNSVELAERRIESAALNLEAGRADTRDILEAQEDLLAAQNAATSTLINFWMARYDLYLDMESLRVEETGIRIEAPRSETP